MLIRNDKGQFKKGVIPINKIVLPELELKQLYQEMGAKKIAEHFKVSKPTVLRNLHEYNIIIRESGAPSKMPKYWKKALRISKSVPVWNKGQTKKTNKSLLAISFALSGSNNPHWKGGLKNTRLLNQQYRARKNNSEGSYNLQEWETLKAQYNWTCPCCEKSEPEIKLTVDHIIPLIKRGINYISNIQPLCGKCNSIKGIRIIRYIK